MVKAVKAFSLVLVMLVVMVGCSSSTTGVEQSKINQLERENAMLKEKIGLLEKEKSQGVLSGQLSMTYVEYSFKKRFVPKDSKILALPVEGSYMFRKVEPNTVVTVFDAVNCNNDGIWLYVEVPVYDDPINIKGWIPEAETVALTNENLKLVQSDIQIRKGSYVYEVNDFDKIAVTNPVKETSDLRGRLEQKKDGWARLSCPGGLTIWVQEKDLVYPNTE